MLTKTIYALGPEGTFSDQAARRVQGFFSREQGETPVVAFTRTIPDALKRASSDLESIAVVPIENSEAGTVHLTQDNLLQNAVLVEWELSLSVGFDLIANAPLALVKTLYVMPMAEGQCTLFIGNNLPDVEVAHTNSNVDSGRRLLDHPTSNAAAIVPMTFSIARDDLLLTPGVQNDPRNTTRFLVLRAKSNASEASFARSKTSLVIHPDGDQPGLLCDILTVFKTHGLNLSRIESRPARTRPWAYVFYCDIDNSGGTAEALAELGRRQWGYTLLGTYDRLP